MTVAPGWPAVSGAATFQDIRRSLAGMIARDATGNLRRGILPFSSADLVTGLASMNVSVGGFVAVADRNGAVFIPNVGAQVVAISAAPASGFRWSIIYVKQRETEAPFSDGASGPIIDKVEATTSEADARALLPVGAVELAVVRIQASITATNGAGATITQTFQYTALGGDVVWLRNATEMAAWNPADGASALRLDGLITYQRISGAWVPVSSPWTDYTPAWAGSGGAPALGNGTLVARWRYVGPKTIAIRITLVFGSSTTGGAGDWTFGLPTGLTAHAAGEQEFASKYYTSDGKSWVGGGYVAPGGTVMNPLAPIGGSTVNAVVAKNANTAGTVGTGTPNVGGDYSFKTGSNVAISALLEVA